MRKFYLAAWLVIVGLLVSCGAYSVLSFLDEFLEFFPAIHPFKAYYCFIFRLTLFNLPIIAVAMYFHPGYKIKMSAKRKEK